MNVNQWFNELKEKPTTLWLLLGALAFGVVLLMTGNDAPRKAELQPQSLAQSGVALNDEERLERELTRTLEQIAGAGKIRVDLNLKSENRSVWERQTRSNKRVSQDKGSVQTEEDTNDELVLAKSNDGRDTPVLKEKLGPEIQGVIVVASGAADPRVRQILTDTLTTILNLPAHRVLVIAGRSTQ